MYFIITCLTLNIYYSFNGSCSLAFLKPTNKQNNQPTNRKPEHLILISNWNILILFGYIETNSMCSHFFIFALKISGVYSEIYKWRTSYECWETHRVVCTAIKTHPPFPAKLILVAPLWSAPLASPNFRKILIYSPFLSFYQF